jgi:flagellar assembly factor FliW
MATKEQIVKVMSTRFGPVETTEQELLFFPVGIPGFPDIRRYVVLDHDKDSPLKWLQAVETPEIAFPIIPPTDLLDDYHITVSSEDLAALALDTTADITVYVILTIPHETPRQTTANLKAPIVMNPETKLARQVLIAEDYPIRFALCTGEPATVECAG